MENQTITSNDRIDAAVQGKVLDRTPIYFSGDFAFYRYARHDALQGDYVRNFKESLDLALDGIRQMKHVDAISILGAKPNKAAGAIWLSKTKLPGYELAMDEPWQIDEVAKMTVEDYDVILNKGWKYYQKYYNETYLGISDDDIRERGQYMAYTNEKIMEMGCVNMTNTMGPIVYDCLCAGRGIIAFTRDLYRMPDKVKAVLDVICEEMMVDFRRRLHDLKQAGNGRSFRVGVAPGVRGSCEFLSRQRFDRYMWPLFETIANAVLEAGGTPFFHMDSNWDNVLDYFTQFPAHTCIFDSDGRTDLDKIHDILGSRMCLTANLSSSLLSLGTPDEVYQEARRQIERYGPNGFVMSGACTLPHNTKPENLDAMIAACLE